MSELYRWLDRHDRPDAVWYVKRLAANDTLATHSHQAGPYVPKSVLLTAFPALKDREVRNPDVWFDLSIDSHAVHRRVRAIYYNTKLRGEGTRDETRITNFGGRESVLLDPESTGSLAAFLFIRGACHVWVCRGAADEDTLEERVGPVEPGQFVMWTPDSGRALHLFTGAASRGCRLDMEDIPREWLRCFPTGEEIVRKTVELRTALDIPDARLLNRRACEYELFRSIEQAFYLPRIRAEFKGIEEFIALAQTILQSRKSRSGNSLELHTREIFLEEGLCNARDFQHRPIIEKGKRPDFLFPSQAAYDDLSFPSERLRMLAVKTTCKDRWRQILNEADRIRTKHLLTLQEGVSETQFREMRDAGVQLVVPKGVHSAFPASIRCHLMNLQDFIAEVRSIACPTRLLA